MVKNNPADFACPGCQARYKLVRVKSELPSRNFPLHCKLCKQPLAATDGGRSWSISSYAAPRRGKPKRICGRDSHVTLDLEGGGRHPRLAAANGTSLDHLVGARS